MPSSHSVLNREKYQVNRQTLRELTIFALLLAIGILGRWAQPEWNFTPLAAVAALGGFYFRRMFVAVLLPVSVLAISDLLLLPHNNWVVLVCVHAMMLVPLGLGRLARRAEGGRRWTTWAVCGVVPATAFYVVTNFAVWAFTGFYDKTLVGLTASYVNGIPFYRTMLAGDVFYLTILVGCLALAGEVTSRRAGEPSARLLAGRG